MSFEFFKIILGDKNRDILNVGLDYSISYNGNKQANKMGFIKRYTSIPENKVDEYFNLYKEVYAEAVDILSNLYKLYRDDIQGKNRRNIKLEFKNTISKKYDWLDKRNLNRLYDKACFDLR